MKKRKTLNKALLKKVEAKLRRLRHEEHYDQSNWGRKIACGTAACIAGHLVLAGGYRLMQDPNGCMCDSCKFGARLEACIPVGKPNTKVAYVCETAIALLGTNYFSYKETAGPYDESDLFLADGRAWPDEYGARWRDKEETGERPSRIAADLLKAIIEGKYKPIFHEDNSE